MSKPMALPTGAYIDERFEAPHGRHVLVSDLSYVDQAGEGRKLDSTPTCSQRMIAALMHVCNTTRPLRILDITSIQILPMATWTALSCSIAGEDAQLARD